MSKYLRRIATASLLVEVAVAHNEESRLQVAVIERIHSTLLLDGYRKVQRVLSRLHRNALQQIVLVVLRHLAACHRLAQIDALDATHDQIRGSRQMKHVVVREWRVHGNALLLQEGVQQAIGLAAAFRGREKLLDPGFETRGSLETLTHVAQQAVVLHVLGVGRPVATTGLEAFRQAREEDEGDVRLHPREVQREDTAHVLHVAVVSHEGAAKGGHLQELS